MRWTIAALTGLAFALAAAGCAQIFGFDKEYREVGDGGGGGGPTSSATTSSGPDSGDDCAPELAFCAGACVDLQTDPANCGACGTDCGDIPCVQNRCGPEIIAAAQDNPVDIALDGRRVYWLNEGDLTTSSGALKAVPQGGGVVITLAANQAAPFALAVRGGLLYWTNRNDSTVWRMTTSGLNPVQLVDDDGVPAGIAVDSANVYWANEAGRISKRPLSGGAPTELATLQQKPYDVAVDATTAYWTDQAAGTVMRAPIDGGAMPAAIASGQSRPRSLAVDAESVYWVNQDDGRVMRASLQGGSPIEIASTVTPLGIAIDDTHVYWTDISTHAVYKVPKGGGDLTALSRDGDFQLPRGIALDDKHVYVTTKDAVLRLAK